MTSLLVILCLAAQAPADTLYPYNTGTVAWNYVHGYPMYSKSYGSMGYSSDNGRGWATFDLSALPDSPAVSAAAFEFYQKSVSSGTPRTYHVRTLMDPQSADPEQLHTWISYGPNLASAVDHPAVGWVRREFHPAGVLAIDSCLGMSRVTVGVCPSSGCGRGSAWGTDGGDLRPRLILRFVQAGLAGQPAPALTRARLAPNPAGKWVTLGGVQDLVLYDRDGREVRRLEHGRNDLSGLESGVYFAPGYGKLVVRR
ncbi:MAG: T9SS type A sorting domain-containing protein [bacterium]